LKILRTISACPGYKSGLVQLWEVSGEQPVLLGTAPTHAALTAFKADTLRPVTALDLVPEQGMVITGHAKGACSAAPLLLVLAALKVRVLMQPVLYFDDKL
jgi:hypothetical protein